MSSFSPEVLAIKQEIDHLFVDQPNSQATLNLLGGFVQKKRYGKPDYSWEEHRKWVEKHSNPIKLGVPYGRSASTNCEHQVYVVNTTFQVTEMSENPYVCSHLYPFGEGNKKMEFRFGFICAGLMNNGSYETARRPEDHGDDQPLRKMKRYNETFGAKLYFLDRSKPIDRSYPFVGTELIFTARVRMNEVIAFRCKVRTNCRSHRDGNNFDATYRHFENGMGDWGIGSKWPRDIFLSNVSHEAEMRYHNKMHSLVYQLIT